MTIRPARRIPPMAFDTLERRGLMAVSAGVASELPALIDRAAPATEDVFVLDGPRMPVLDASEFTVFEVSRISDTTDIPPRLVSVRPASEPIVLFDGPVLPSPAVTVGGGTIEVTSPLPPNLGPTSPLGAVGPAPFVPGPIVAAPTTPSPWLARVTMAAATTVRGGVVGTTFAFANRDQDLITVRNGSAAPVVVGTQKDGVSSPDDVKLVDLDGDANPDLIVANAGADNVLVYLGKADGKFSSEALGGGGIAVGARPAGITVGDIDGDGIADMIVANRDSNDVSLLLGRGSLSDWSLVDGGRLRAGVAPVSTLLEDVDQDGILDILICNSGSNSVFVLRGLGGGRFDDENPKILSVGDGPVQMVLGRFDSRSESGLLTVNSRSNDLTVISNFMGERPQTRTIDSGGVAPSSASAADFDSDGLTDLIVANSGDGKLALFQGDDDGLSLTSLVSASAIPNPTSILAGDRTENGFDIFAVSSGQDAASVLHFETGFPSDDEPYAPPLTTEPTEDRPSDDEDLSAQLISHGDSEFNLVGVLGFSSSRREASDQGGFDGKDPSTGRMKRARSEGQSLDDEEDLLGTSPGPDEVPYAPELIGADDPTTWARFVLGLDEALGEAREAASQAIASQAFVEGEPGADGVSDGLALLDPASARAEFQSEAAVDGAIRALWPSGADEAPLDESVPANPGLGRVEENPTVSLGVIFAHQMLIRVAPPRRPRVRPRMAARSNMFEFFGFGTRRA